MNLFTFPAFFLTAVWISGVMAGIPAIVLDHQVTLEMKPVMLWMANLQICYSGRKNMKFYLVQVMVLFSSVQFNSVSQLCPTLCYTMDCRMPGFPVRHCILEFAQTHIHRVGDAIQPSHPLSFVPFSSCLQSSPALGSFPMSQFFTSGAQSIGVSASASVLPLNIQD